MSSVLSISASPQAVSSTHAVLTHVNRRIVGAGHTVRTVQVRELPPAALLSADASDPAIADAIAAVAAADAVVVATPVYQAAYSGLLKVFLDLLPQFAFRGKAVLPIVTGGSTGARPGGRLRAPPGPGQPGCRTHRAGLVRAVGRTSGNWPTGAC